MSSLGSGRRATADVPRGRGEQLVPPPAHRLLHSLTSLLVLTGCDTSGDVELKDPSGTTASDDIGASDGDGTVNEEDCGPSDPDGQKRVRATRRPRSSWMRVSS